MLKGCLNKLKNGKREELTLAGEWEIYEVVPEEEPKQQGKKIEDTTWVIRFDNLRTGGSVILHKDDLEAIERYEHDPDYICRARLCCRQYNWSEKRDDVFAPASTPNTGRVVDYIAVKMGWPTFTLDASRAFWQVIQEELCYVRPPAEWYRTWTGPQNVVWKMLRWLYGQRTAPGAWTEHLAKEICKLQMVRDEASPNLFFGAPGGPFEKIVVDCHADDVHGTAPPEKIEGFLKRLKEVIVWKSCELHGLNSVYKHLRRERRRSPEGTMIVPNVKHVEKALALMGMEGCKEAPTPMVSEIAKTELENDAELDAEKAKLYRSITMLLMYFVVDIFVAQYAVKELSREMQKPQESSWNRLKRVLRFLQGCKDLGVWFPREGDMTSCRALADSNWGNCRKTRKSTSAGLIIFGGCTLYQYSRTQPVLADSSGVAEWYAVTSVAAEGLYLQDLLKRMGFWMATLEIETDSAAAKGMGCRIGAGKLRTLEIKTLWLQGILAEKKAKLKKVKDEDHPVDLGTKAYTAEVLERLLAACGLRRWKR